MNVTRVKVIIQIQIGIDYYAFRPPIYIMLVYKKLFSSLQCKNIRHILDNPKLKAASYFDCRTGYIFY